MKCVLRFHLRMESREKDAHPAFQSNREKKWETTPSEEDQA